MELTTQPERLRAIVEHSPLGLGFLSAQGHWLFVNPALCRLLDYTAPQLLELSLSSLIEPEEVVEIDAALAQLREGAATSVMLEKNFRRRNGWSIGVQLALGKAGPDGEAPTCFVAQLTDLTQRSKSGRASRDAEHILQRVLAIGTITAYSLQVVDGTVALSWISEGIGRLGYADHEVLGADWWPQCIHPLDATMVKKAWQQLLRRGHDQIEYRLQRKDGTYAWVRDDRVIVGKRDGRLIEVSGMWTEVTERRQVEAQAQHAQRMESLGLLAAGIVHDLNNILTPILIATPLLREHAVDHHDTAMIDLLEKSALRGSTLLRQILTFARQREGEAGAVNVKHVLDDLRQMIGETFPRSIVLEHRVPSDLYLVHGHASQLHQVLLNLCINARDAMPDGGRLAIIGENCTLDNLPADNERRRSRATWIKIEVSDTGAGMTPDVLARLWDPFFTTKPTGTGLGLSTVKGLVSSHGGFMEVRSSPGAGTTFTVYLPADAESVAGNLLSSEPAPPAPRGAGETVLVVDDEASLREMIGTMLRAHGYQVLAASDGIEAIALFQDRTNDIRLLVTDIHMPHMQGHVLVQVAKRLRPHVKCLTLTGHPEEGKLPLGGPAERADVMMFKPFAPREFLRKVHELIGRPSLDETGHTLPLWSSS